MTTQIARIGRTIAVEIPEELLEAASLAVGSTVAWTLTPENTLELLPADEMDGSTKSRRWEEILARLTAAHDADAPEEALRGFPEAEDEDKTDWTLSHGLEYKKPRWE